MLVKVFASGTNVQRLAKGSGRADGVIYTAYSQLENSQDDIVKRRFYMLEVDSLKKDVEELDETVQPSWTKIWGKPNANKSFISKLFLSLVGEEPLRQEINLCNLSGESIDCFMMLVSANKREMKQIKDIADRAIPNYHVKILNGDYTNNKQAEFETIKEINEAKIEGKDGVIIIANQMGSRSYSVSEIQATVIAYDRGSVDATMQKVSRCLTPGSTYAGERKEYGHILDLSFDPNRAENIERLLVDEIVQVGKSKDQDFPAATTYVLSTIDCFRVKYGTAVEVDEEDMFELLGDNESLLRIADVTVDVNAALDIIDDLANVTISGKKDKKTREAIDKAKNTVRESGKSNKTQTNSEKKQLEKIINDAVRSLNMSATSVFLLAYKGNTYRECIESIKRNSDYRQEFQDLYGIDAFVVIEMLDRCILNEPVLDVIVQNSINSVDSPFI